VAGQVRQGRGHGGGGAEPLALLAASHPVESPSSQGWDAGPLESLNLPASLCAGLRFTPEQFTELAEGLGLDIEKIWVV
jgi:hypothetical protein